MDLRCMAMKESCAPAVVGVAYRISQRAHDNSLGHSRFPEGGMTSAQRSPTPAPIISRVVSSH